MGAYSDAILALAPKAYYRLGETTGNALDSSGFAHPGTVEGNPIRGVAGIVGDDDRAIELDGSGDRISVATNVDIDITGTALTLIAWLKGLAVDNPLGSFEQYVRKSDLFAAGYTLGGGNFQYCSFTVYSVASSQTQGHSYKFLDGAWHMVAGRYDGANVQAFVDGLGQPSPPAFTDAIETTTESLYLGSMFDGVIDECAVFNVALTNAQLLDLYKIGSTDFRHQAFRPGPM